jgi:hypothetical protein
MSKVNTFTVMKKSTEDRGMTAGYTLRTEDLGAFLSWRAKVLFGGDIAAFAEALGITRQQLWAIRKGKWGLSPAVMKKLNELDPEYTVMNGFLVEDKPSKSKGKK